MRYREAMKILRRLERFGIKFGLTNIRRMMRELGNPHNTLPCVHITGTNGKGSVAAFLASILEESGLRVGLYTSPHLIDFRERIRINGKMISMSRLTSLINTLDRINRKLNLKTTYFEFATALALWYFFQQNADIALLEVGMGGRLDATNVIPGPQACVVTNISMEHTAYLGSTLKKIAREKAGIIKEKCPVISGIAQPFLVQFIERYAHRQGAPFYQLGRNFFLQEAKKTGNSQSFDFKGPTNLYTGLTIGLLGKHQLYNAALAVATAEILAWSGWPVRKSHIKRGLRRAFWPARLELIKRKGRRILIDGAHNPAAVCALKSALSNGWFPARRLVLILGILKDKDARGILAPLLPMADQIIFTRPCSDRALSEKILLRQAKDIVYGKSYYVVPNTDKALAKAFQLCRSDSDLICATGSLYTAGEIRRLLIKRPGFTLNRRIRG